MTQGEVIKSLRAQGIDATPAKVGYAVRIGRIPRPAADGAGNLAYTAAHVALLKSALQKAAKLNRGRKPQPR